MIRVLVADDHSVVRRGVRQILCEEFDSVEVGEAGDSHQLDGLLRQGPWDLLILDITLPGKSGLDVLQEVRKSHPGLKVLILSMHPEDQFAIRMLRAGAAGYLTKERAPEELVLAVRRVLSGKKYLTESLAETLAGYVEAQGRVPPHAALSDREFQVLRMLASGKSLSEIAEELALSVKTISTYRARILEKMNMRSNAELIHYAVKNGLVD